MPSARNTRNRSNERANHRSWVTASTVPVNSSSASCNASRRGQVQVVGRLVEQQQGRAGQFQQQDLEPGLLPTGQRLEPLVPRRRRGRSGSARTSPRRGPLLPVAVAVPQHVHQRAADPLRDARGSARTDPAPPGRRAATNPCASTVPPASSRRKWLLPEPLEPSTATRSPKNISTSNGCIRPVSSSRGARDRADAGPDTAQPRLDLVLAAAAPAAARPPRTCAAGSARPRTATPWPRSSSPALQRPDQLLQLLVLLVPAPVQFGDTVPARLPGRRARWRIRRRAPRRAGLQGDHGVAALASSSRSWLTSSTALWRLGQPLLQPALARHVQVVVRLVEQQHLLVCRAAAPPAPAASARRRTACAPAGTGPGRTGRRARQR